MPSTSSLTSGVQVPIVKISLEDCGSFHGILTHIGSTAVGFAFPRTSAPPLEVGEHRVLSVGAERVGSNVDVRGLIQTRWEDCHRVAYSIEVGNDDLTALAILIERRGALRVEPNEPLRCLLFSLDGAYRVEATLEDISSTGARVLVPHVSSGAVQAQEAMTLCMLLPGDEETLEVVSLVRNRDTVNEGLCVGLEFVARAAGEFMRIQERVDRFVLRRQADSLAPLAAINRIHGNGSSQPDESD